MENVSTVTKILEYLSKPINFSILISLFLISGVVYLLNFLSDEILIQLKIYDFLNNFSFIIFLILISTFFLILVQLVYYIGRKIDKKIKVKRFKKLQKKVFEDQDCKKVLLQMYQQHPNSVDCPVDNYCIKMLSQYNLIVLASNMGHMGYNGEQIFPYVLQAETVKKLNYESRNFE